MHVAIIIDQDDLISLLRADDVIPFIAEDGTDADYEEVVQNMHLFACLHIRLSLWHPPKKCTEVKYLIHNYYSTFSDTCSTSNCSTMSRPIAGRRPKKKTSPTRTNANGKICSWHCESPDGLYLKTLVERGRK
jgi:hypothetical protein